jgi:hypothetical protein
MSKIGRNDPCPCGSGEKYKRCCQGKDEAAQRIAREASNAELQADVEAGQAAIAGQLDRYQQCTQATTAVFQLIQARNFAQAEAAAREHMERFPEVPDGYDLMGMLCEARNEPLQAAQWYRQVVAFIRAHPDVFSAKDETRYQRRIQRLDPTTAEP